MEEINYISCVMHEDYVNNFSFDVNSGAKSMDTIKWNHAKRGIRDRLSSENIAVLPRLPIDAKWRRKRENLRSVSPFFCLDNAFNFSIRFQ